MSHTLILGIGNTLLTDEGAGVHAMHYLQARTPKRDDIEFLDGGAPSFVLADAIAEATDLIVFDAAELGAEPGSLRLFEGSEFDDFLLGGRHSVREVGFSDLMAIAGLQDCLPDNRALIGIQPGDFGWGEQPGERVKAALPDAAALALEVFHRWACGPTREAVNQ